MIQEEIVGHGSKPFFKIAYKLKTRSEQVLES